MPPQLRGVLLSPLPFDRRTTNTHRAGYQKGSASSKVRYIPFPQYLASLWHAFSARVRWLQSVCYPVASRAVRYSHGTRHGQSEQRVYVRD